MPDQPQTTEYDIAAERLKSQRQIEPDHKQATLSPAIADVDLRMYLDARVEVAVAVRDQLWRAALAEFPKSYPELFTSRLDWYIEDFTGWPDREREDGK